MQFWRLLVKYRYPTALFRTPDHISCLWAEFRVLCHLNNLKQPMGKQLGRHSDSNMIYQILLMTETAVRCRF